MNTTTQRIVLNEIAAAALAGRKIPKPGKVTFNRARRELTAKTPTAERELILRARARAEGYYITAVLEEMGEDRLYVWNHLFFAGHFDREEIIFRRTMADNHILEDTTFQKRDLEVL